MVLLGKVLGGATVAVLHGCLVLVLARFADVPLTPCQILQALGLMVLLAFALTSLGVVIANRVRSFEGFGVFSNAVILPLYFTSSSIFPLDPALTRAQTRVVYPDWLVTIVAVESADLCGRCAARRADRLQPVRSAPRPAGDGRRRRGAVR